MRSPFRRVSRPVRRVRPARVRRVGVAAAPAAVLAVKIATEPPASAATLTVDVDAVSATPAVSVLPTSMTWNAGNAAKQRARNRQHGEHGSRLRGRLPASTSRFVWTGVPATKLDPESPWSPPIDVGVKANSSPGTEHITVRAVLAGTSMPELPGFPVQVTLTVTAAGPPFIAVVLSFWSRLRLLFKPPKLVPVQTVHISIDVRRPWTGVMAVMHDDVVVIAALASLPSEGSWVPRAASDRTGSKPTPRQTAGPSPASPNTR